MFLSLKLILKGTEMGKKLIKHYVITALIVFLSTTLSATELKLDGSIGYKFHDDKVTIFADKIMNKSIGGKSGTIKLAVYATDSFYDAGGLYGYILGEHTFDRELYGEYNFLNVQKTVDYKEPPIGKYYITIALLEFDGKDFKITDFASFKEPVLFGLAEDVKKQKDLEKEKDQQLAEKNKENELEEKKKKADEYKFSEDLRTQTLLTVLILGGLRHMVNVP